MRQGNRRHMQTIEAVLSARNLTEACSEVVKNKGAGGIDGMSVGQLKSFLQSNREELCKTIREGKYIPHQPIRGKEILKRSGKTRLLGIPTVIERMLQQAVSRVIMPQFEYMFSVYSYGFRPQRNTQQAVLKSLDYINSGYQQIVDIDLKGFFDEIDHCLLLGLLYRKVKCPVTMQLIRRWLRAPIWINGQYQLIVEKSRWKQLKAKLKKETRKTSPMTFDERVQKIKAIQRGWINNFRLANIQGKLKDLDGWLRNRLRYCIWHHWKKRERKRKNLIRLGVNPHNAFRWSRSRLGGWAIAQSPILNTTITVELLRKRGYESMLWWYQKVASHKFTPTLFPIV